MSVTLEDDNRCGAKEDARSCIQRNFGDQSEIILFDGVPKYEVVFRFQFSVLRTTNEQGSNNTRALRVKNATAEGVLSLIDYNALAAKYGGSEEVQKPGKYRVDTDKGSYIVKTLADRQGQYSASDTQSVSSTPLAEQDRKRLDSIVQQMHANGEQDSSVQSVVDDFKQEYSRSAPPNQTSQTDSTIKSVGAIVAVDVENTTRADITLPQAVRVMQARKGTGALHDSLLKLDRDYFYSGERCRELARKLEFPKGVTLHVLRHSHASQLLSKGAPLPVVLSD